MRIGTNMPAWFAIHNQSIAQKKVATALCRISSGKKINTAADDPAGNAISRKMQLQIIGLKRASQNSLDGISLVQTADGALNEMHDIIQRMRELSVQAANDSYTYEERAIIQKEICQLTSEINKESLTAEFNKIKLFDGCQEPDSNAHVTKASCAEPYSITVTQASLANLNANDEIYFELSDGKVTDKVRLSTDGLEGLTPAQKLEKISEKINDALGDKAIAYRNDAGDFVIQSRKASGDTSIKITGVDYVAVSATGGVPYEVTLDRITGGPTGTNSIVDGDEIIIEVANNIGTKTVKLNTAELAVKTNKELLDRLNGLLDGYATASFDGGALKIKSSTSTDDTRIKFSGKNAGKLISTAPVKGLANFQVPGIITDPDSPNKQIAKVVSTPANFTKQAEGSINFLKEPEHGSHIVIGTKTIGFYDPKLGEKGDNTIEIDITGKTKEQIAKEVINEYNRIETEAKPPISNDAYTFDGLKLALDPNTQSRIIITAPEIGEIGEFMRLSGHKDYNEVPIQFGANAFDMFDIKINKIDAVSLRIASNSTYGNPRVAGAKFSSVKNVVFEPGSMETQYALDVTTQRTANYAITVFNNALNYVSSLRSDMGAVQNRLEHTVKYLDGASENLTDAMSRIADADLAEEFTIYSNQNIISQAANAMLAQSNQIPGMVMKLLE